MVATRRTPRVTTSLTRNHNIREAFHRPAGSSKPRGGLTKELAALGIITQPKKSYDGPGYQGNDPRVVEGGRECSICAESQQQRQFPEDDLVKTTCDHDSNICRTCIARHTENNLVGNGKWRHVQCLFCHVKLSKAQVCKLVWKEDFKRLEEFAKGKADEANPRYRACLETACNAGQVHRKLKTEVVTCKSCGAHSCFNHRVPWHEGYTCNQYSNSHPDAELTRTSEDMVKKLAKKCPGSCGYYIEKNGGCDNMYCHRCRTSFHWRDVPHEKVARVKR